MAVFTEDSVRANIRNRDGKRVFYLAEGNHLTPSAREWLRKERIEILPAESAAPTIFRTLDGMQVTEKPERMTHLRNGVLVPKQHPRIRFRGAMDTLQAELLCVGNLAASKKSGSIVDNLNELLDAARLLLRCEVLEEPISVKTLLGETPEQLRQKSQHPERWFDQPHFMPAFTDSELLLALNRLRTRIRETELLACDAFCDRDGRILREDIVMLLNRMSSAVWIMMIRLKKEESRRG